MNIENQIIDLLNGELTPNAKEDIMDAINSDPSARSLYEDYKVIYSNIDGLTDSAQLPSDRIKSNLKSIIENEIIKDNNKGRVIRMNSPLMVKLSSIAAILMAGLFIGQYIISSANDKSARAEIAMLRSHIEENINSTSVSTRIKAVNYGRQLQSHDATILDVIINTAATDQNTNVRLAAVQALSKHIEAPQVPLALGNMLVNEQDPAVQIAIIESLSQVQSEKIMQSLERVTNDIDAPQYVKDEAHHGLLKMKHGQIL